MTLRRFLAGVLVVLGVFIVGLAFKSGQSSSVRRAPITLPANSSPPRPTKTISGLIVPHHNLVATQRRKLFTLTKDAGIKPRTVVLISPNHDANGRESVQTTSQVWTTAEGEIKPDTPVIKGLIADGVGDEPESFANERGVDLILPDIKATFPEAQIVPIIFKIDTPLETVNRVRDALLVSCGDCLMIASVDFSHNQPALLADLHDSLSRRALENLDAAELYRAETDSPPALALLVNWAKSHGTKKLVLNDHTNSGVLAGNPDIATTTHFFGWYESGEPTTPTDSVSFIVGGDMMFGRFIAHTFLARGLETSLDQIGERVFWGTDASVINLEGPVSDRPVVDNIAPNNLTFNFPPEAIKALKFIKINVASLANNHSSNAGADGLATTRRLLTDAAIQPFGGPGESDAAAHLVRIKGQGLTLIVVGINAVFTSPNIVPLIKELRQEPASRIVIFPHWGIEYVYRHTTQQEQLAHAWIDAGADMVIGSHPHVIEDSELYRGRPIIYSLGNFLFDQTFSPETQQGLLVAGQFKATGLELFALPIQSTKLKPALLGGDAKSALLTRLYAPFDKFKQSTPAGELLVFPPE